MKKNDKPKNIEFKYNVIANEYKYSLVGKLFNGMVLSDKINANDIVDAYEKVLELLNKINEHFSDEDEKFIIGSIELVMEK